MKFENWNHRHREKGMSDHRRERFWTLSSTSFARASNFVTRAVVLPTLIVVGCGVVQRESTHATNEVWAAKTVGMKFRLISAGSFEMGSRYVVVGRGPKVARSDDPQTRPVTITRDFWLGETEVTQGQWLMMTGKNPSLYTECGNDCPAEQISWVDSVAFANALSRREGFQPCYEVNDTNIMWRGLGCEGFRLPTEAEWEYAARAGTTTPFWTGDVLGESRFASKSPVAVGSYRPNPWGLYDVHGNVWEWVWDRYAEYPAGPAIDPVGPEDGDLRVMRGGGWSSEFWSCRSAARYWGQPEFPDVLGVRLARTASPESDR